MAVVSVGARTPLRHPSPDTLARLEARIVFEELFPRIPEYAVAGPVIRVPTPTVSVVSTRKGLNP